MSNRYMAILEGTEHELEVEELAANSLRVKFDNNQFDVDVRQVGRTSFSILVGERAFDLEVAREGDELLVASRGSSTRVTLIDAARRRRGGADGRPDAAGRAELKAMMPGRVVNLLVSVGEEVVHRQGVVVVEAMKMENELKSPKTGKVVEIRVAPGQTVEKGEILLVIE